MNSWCVLRPEPAGAQTLSRSLPENFSAVKVYRYIYIHIHTLRKLSSQYCKNSAKELCSRTACLARLAQSRGKCVLDMPVWPGSRRLRAIVLLRVGRNSPRSAAERHEAFSTGTSIPGLGYSSYFRSKAGLMKIYTISRERWMLAKPRRCREGRWF